MRSLDQNEPEGRQVGRYLVYGELASGGMATVHLGRLLGPAGFSKTVAIKRLHQHLATEPDFVTALIDEAKLASFIHHPNVVSSLDVVAEGDELLLVMDYVEGETLARLLGHSRKDVELRSPSIAVIVRVLTDVLAGLHAAHTAKTHGGRPLRIVHRDVSPQNIMIGVDGIARVLDFGIAKAAHRQNSTRPGRIKGKFAYMSPEQVRGNPVDARTDVFAAGVVLWECLTRRRLFATTDKNALPRVLTAVVPPPSSLNPEVSVALDRVVLKALSRDRDARFASAADFADALSAVAEQSSSVEVGRWVAAAAKKTLHERSRLFDNVEENTVDGVLGELEARAEDKTKVLGPPRDARAEDKTKVIGPPREAREARETRETTKSSRPPTALSLPLVRTPAPPWPRVTLIALGVAALVALGSSVFSGSVNQTAPAPAARPVTPKSEAVKPPERVADAPQAPIVVATDLPRLPAEAEAAAKTNEPTGTETALVESPESAPASSSSAARTAHSGRTRASKPAPAKLASKPAASAPSTATKPAPSSTESAPVAASCDPPYRVDAAGIRRVKRECL